MIYCYYKLKCELYMYVHMLIQSLNQHTIHTHIPGLIKQLARKCSVKIKCYSIVSENFNE